MPKPKSVTVGYTTVSWDGKVESHQHTLSLDNLDSLTRGRRGALEVVRDFWRLLDQAAGQPFNGATQ